MTIVYTVPAWRHVVKSIHINAINTTLGLCLITFRALTLLAEHQEEQWACKNWVMMYWHGYLSRARCNWFAHDPADATATPSPLDTHLHTHTQPFTALFPGPTGWASARKELLNFMVQGKINRGRHINHPDGRHSIWTKQCHPPP